MRDESRLRELAKYRAIINQKHYSLQPVLFPNPAALCTDEVNGLCANLGGDDVTRHEEVDLIVEFHLRLLRSHSLIHLKRERE